MDRYEIAIIGAGFAGAASAWHLAQQGVKSVVILEQEEFPGMHSSGLNASMIRQFEEDQVIAKCSNEGARFIQKPPEHWKNLLDQVGSLILFKHSRLDQVKKALDDLGTLKFSIINKDNAQDKVPLLVGADFDHAVWTESDGVVDINELLWSYIKDAKAKGAELRARQRVVSIRQNDDKSFIIETEDSHFQVNKIVNAAGAWAGEFGQMCGASDIKLTPLRRHLYTAEVMKDVNPKWPFVWDVDNEYYFRPESGGLLLGPCDEEESKPGVPSTSHKIRELLAEKLSKFCPSLSDLKIAREWAGLRTFAEDRRFIIGEDPKLENFFWVAGLGGWGVTSSYTVGKLVADAVLNDSKNVPNELKPNRFNR